MTILELSNMVDLYGESIYRFCHTLTTSKAEADDLYQDTFLKATEICHKIDVNGNPKAFLISISVRLWKNNIRKFTRRSEIAPEFHIEDVPSHAIQPDLEERMLVREQYTVLRNAVEKLSDKLRVPLYMYYTAEMSIEEIAAALKIPQGTVKSRLHKARQILKTNEEVLEYATI